MKEVIDVFDYAGQICKAMKKGILLTTKSGENVNTMTIGWGTLGIEWNRPVFIAYVRESRLTKQLLEEAGEFSVNIPVDVADSQILRICGSKSGRDMNKIQELSLTLETPDIISAPGIKELPLTLECKVIYKQKQDASRLPVDIQKRFYPEEHGEGEHDCHIAYYGEILKAYLIRE